MKPKIIKADKGKYFFFSGLNGKEYVSYVYFSEDGLMSFIHEGLPELVVMNFQEISKAQYYKIQKEKKRRNQND